LIPSYCSTGIERPSRRCSCLDALLSFSTEDCDSITVDESVLDGGRRRDLVTECRLSEVTASSKPFISDSDVHGEECGGDNVALPNGSDKKIETQG